MSCTAAFFLLAALPLGQSPELAARGGQPDDACLHDVLFVDAQNGWAVGDRGAILHTADGGQRWLPQVSGVNCTLNSVHFVNVRTGWAAGGMVWPFLRDTSGVVLSTRDGGATWQREPVLLPALKKIRFFTERQGWAVGCSSAMNPGGVFLTRDGGQSWQPASSGGASGLTTGDFYDAQNAILAGSRGLLATISGGEFARKSAGPVLPAAHAAQAVPPSYGWLVGDGGWVALTADRGNTWGPPLGKLPACATTFDFAALAVRGGKCWVAGTPGSRIFWTADAGRSWNMSPTGITTPLRAIAFADDDHGWAVGQLGAILATSDGGRSWQRQRAAGEHAALMLVAGRSEDLPLELIARTCKDQSFFGVSEVVGREDMEAGRSCDASPADCLHEAMLRVGGCGGELACGFSVRPAALELPSRTIVENWNRYHRGRAEEALVAHLVRQIRTWRPEVLVVSNGRDSDPLARLVRQSVEAAVKHAAAPADANDANTAIGCGPWNVPHVYLASDSTSRSAAMTCDDWSPRLGQSWADAALPARGLLGSDGHAGPAGISVQRIGGFTDNSAAKAGDVMADIRPVPGGNARRTNSDASRPQGALDGLALHRQVASALAQLDQDPEALIARLMKGDALPQGIDAAEAATLTYRIADRMRHAGRWDLADKALGALIERYPSDVLTRWAIVCRLRYMANVSGTLRMPGESGTRSVPDTLVFARQIEAACPDLFASPAIRYPLAAVYRRRDQDAQAQRLYVLDRRGVERDAWWNVARGERWLADRKGPSPRPMVACIEVNERPHLDGRLDEPLWKKCPPITLASPLGDDRDWPATVRLARDEKFLYVAVQCRQAPGAHYEATNERRTRDADLSQHDRVDILLDLDRTYASYYQLTIDHRGWAADECCGDRSWNPKWFVAVDPLRGYPAADNTWRAEAAIPLAELNAAIVPGKTVWALGIQRTVPGVGFQAWTAPAAAEVMPEGFGWMEFE